ncbi:hypothetical protein RQP46_004750 [Phenoliferia psychrophenolica]
MLNDIFSLVVALQALKLAEGNSASATYSYGWQRAEVLGALINGVFLLALCLSIGLEAFTRFFQSVDHGHSHGGHSHGHSHGGHSHGSGGGHSHADLESGGRKRSHSGHSHHSHSAPTDRTPLLASTGAAPAAAVASSSTSESTKVVSSASSSSGEEDEVLPADIEDELFVHPGEFRDNVVKRAHDAGYGATASGSKGHGHSHSLDHSAHAGHGHGHDDSDHTAVEHSHNEEAGGHGGHGEDGSMNMRGVFLHVLGDALGNVGVIGAGLFIWLTDYSWRFYVDPLISLLITCIIFSSALPLVKSASFILLQGVPSSVPLDEVRNAIAAVPGVLNVHELHIWSLSESKTVCSVHVMTAGDDFVPASKAIRRVLHRFGVHSSTIQPEIVGGSDTPATQTVEETVAETDQDGCLVLCVDDSCRTSSCCPPDVPAAPAA